MAEPCSLYLVRHAIAADRGSDYPDDSKRPLTSRGISRFKKAARGFASLGPGIELVLTSPLTRARQTADILADVLPEHPPVVETPAMEPGGRFADLLAELGAQSRRGVVALVGHEPSISQFAARLLGARGTLEFKKGGIARIDVDAFPPTGPGRLVWLVPPRVFVGLED
jgi:phosphohistidine phosphatase